MKVGEDKRLIKRLKIKLGNKMSIRVMKDSDIFLRVYRAIPMSKVLEMPRALCML